MLRQQYHINNQPSKDLPAIQRPSRKDRDPVSGERIRQIGSQSDNLQKVKSHGRSKPNTQYSPRTALIANHPEYVERNLVRPTTLVD
jgi:hypothetical protein